MRFTRLPFLLVLFLAQLFFCSGMIHAQFGLNQERISESEWSRGFHGFNMIAEGNDLERISLREFRSSPASDVLVVVLGRLSNLPLHVTNHVNKGGAALVASDSSQRFLDSRFAGFLFAELPDYPTRDSEAFGGMVDCPLIKDLSLIHI